MSGIGFTTLYSGISPPTPTIKFNVRWLGGARWTGCPLQQDFCMAQGDDVRFIGQARDFTGALQEIVGATDIVFALFTAPGGTEVFRAATSDSSILIGAPEEFYFSIRTATSSLFTRRSYWHETLIINSDGWRNTVLNGRFLIEKTNIGALA